MAHPRHGGACGACAQQAGRDRWRAEHEFLSGGRGGRELPPLDVERFLSFVGEPDPIMGCMEWAGATKDSGYGIFTEHYHQRAAHRLAYALAHGEVPAGKWVLHSCDNPPCCNPDDLYLGDHDQNMDDMVARKRSRKGERHHAGKMTNEKVAALRAAYADGASPAQLAHQYDIAVSMSLRIATGRAWVHLPGVAARTHLEATPRGERHPDARLTEDDVRSIRQRASEGYAVLAREYGVTRQNIRAIVTRRTWKHVA